MDKITASEAKQSFGRVLARAAEAPVGIERHGKVVAAMVPPEWLEQAHLLDARRRAREEQRQVEMKRLMAHQMLAIDLLTNPERRRELLQTAHAEVQRWADQSLCSRDYIERWNAWLALPAAELAQRMCSEAEGWGTAMRQNSPFAVAYR